MKIWDNQEIDVTKKIATTRNKNQVFNIRHKKFYISILFGADIMLIWSVCESEQPTQSDGLDHHCPRMGKKKKIKNTITIKKFTHDRLASNWMPNREF